MMSSDPANPFLDFSGTGNTLNFGSSHVRQMVLDSLRYWRLRMGIDGFRFDLASIFSRNPDGSLNLSDPPIFSEIASDPALRNLRLIAEPWDAAGAYQLGHVFPGITWLQWNGRFRDDVRRFVRGDSGMVENFLRRMYGSDDFFPDDRENAYHAYQSVNFVDSHDGFTLYDLVSYDEKHNLANGHNNTDGTDENYSWNCGYEGDEAVPPEVMALRRRQVKNYCSLMMLANGTPMFRAGDEFLQTQRGNNNPYNQDNELSWLDWDRWRNNQDIFRFFKEMIAFRKAHPSLGRSRFWRGDVRWYGVGSAADFSYNSHTLAYYLNGESHADDDIYVMVNAYWEALNFTIQQGTARQWRRVVDTSLPTPDDITLEGVPIRKLQYRVGSRSVVVFVSPRAAA
jgi:isoamylase